MSVRRRLGVVVVAWLLCPALHALRAGDASPAMPDVSLQGVASGRTLNAGFRTDTGRVLAETVSIRQGVTRVDFQVQGQPVHLLRKAEGLWLVSEKAGLLMPVPGSKRIALYVYPVDRPCGGFGGSCDRAESRRIAGRDATAWHFRHAGSSGPDGADSGTLWIDDRYGLLLGYEARDMQGRPLSWRVTTVSFVPLAADRFTLPGDGPVPPKSVPGG